MGSVAGGGTQRLGMARGAAAAYGAPAMIQSGAARRYVWVVSFTSGMCVMALEMTASRVVSPHFGTSLSVWANVIGLILVALALGYWWGGRWAERSPELPTLLRILAAAAGLAALIPFLSGPLARGFVAAFAQANGSSVIRVGSFVVVALLFFAPVLLLGMSSPFVIKLLARDAVGDTSGRVFALSTVGSLVGTFAPAFWLVPAIGTRATVWLFAGLLFAVVGFGLFGRRLGWLAVLPLLLLPLVSRLPIKPDPAQLAEAESEYQYVEVANEVGGYRSLKLDEGTMMQSRERADTPFTEGYWDALFLLPSLSPAPSPKVLILGFAVGTAARGMLETRAPGALDVTGVELDPKVLELGRRYFSIDRLLAGGHLKLAVDDARVFLERDGGRYDFILLDCYANQRYIPPHLVTREFFQLVRAHLAPGGVFVANANAPGPSSTLLRSLDRTLAEVFAHLERLDVPKKWNRELVASNTPLDWGGAGRRLPEGLRERWPEVLTWRVQAEGEGGLLLTDDRAPVELMIDAELAAH